MWRRVRLPWLGLFGLSLLLIAGVDLFRVLASAKVERGTQSWRIDVPYSPFGSVAVTVVDTTGVCLYLVDGSHGMSGIAAIPKSTLPQGVGCQ